MTPRSDRARRRRPALVLEVALLGAAWPGPLGLAGLAIIVGGMISYARISAR